MLVLFASFKTKTSHFLLDFYTVFWTYRLLKKHFTFWLFLHRKNRILEIKRVQLLNIVCIFAHT